MARRKNARAPESGRDPPTRAQRRDRAVNAMGIMAGVIAAAAIAAAGIGFAADFAQPGDPLYPVKSSVLSRFNRSSGSFYDAESSAPSSGLPVSATKRADTGSALSIPGTSTGLPSASGSSSLQ